MQCSKAAEQQAHPHGDAQPALAGAPRDRRQLRRDKEAVAARRVIGCDTLDGPAPGRLLQQGVGLPHIAFLGGACAGARG